MLVPVSVCLRNRRVEGEALLIAGQPAPFTIFDRARFDRMQGELGKAESALAAARAEAVKPYALAPEIALYLGDRLERWAALAGWAALSLAGVALGGVGGFGAAQSDAVLLQEAMRDAQHHASSLPSAADQRTFYLVLIGIGVAMLIAGVVGVMERWRGDPPAAG